MFFEVLMKTRIDAKKHVRSPVGDHGRQAPAVRTACDWKCDQRGDEDANERTCRFPTLTLWTPSFSFLPLVGRCTTQ